jgi:DsbC/DsbD-like thiol-disulfide interchange protein
MPKTLALAAVALLGARLPVQAGDSFATPWATGAKSQARLVAASAELAGLEIKLAPGAITYWRDPGDAGLPPTFDFSGSTNLASAEPVFPAPKRIPESDGGVAYGYDSAVTFPIRVVSADAAKPVMLALAVHYAVCEKVCLPAQARLSLALPVKTTSPNAGAVEAALALAPEPKTLAELGASLAPIDAASWRFCAPAQPGSARDLFVEAPEGWWMTTQSEPPSDGRACFHIGLGGKPDGAKLPVEARLTLTGGASPVETRATFASP